MRGTGATGTPKTPSYGGSAANRSVRSERDPDRYFGSGGGGSGDGIEGGDFEYKSPYVIEEQASEPATVVTGPGRIMTRRKEKKAGRMEVVYFDTSVAEPEPGEDRSVVDAAGQ
jgi:hypothetical protein